MILTRAESALQDFSIESETWASQQRGPFVFAAMRTLAEKYLFRRRTILGFSKVSLKCTPAVPNAIFGVHAFG
jgi:hypothetical protein